MQISEICHREVVSIDRNASILEAARKMRAHHVGDVIVTESADGIDRPIGILTDRDIVVELVAKELSIDSVSIADVMSLTMATAKHDSDVFETLRFMGIKGIRRIPVIDSDGGLFGILSIDDVMAVLTKELSFLADIATTQIERETSARP